MEYTILLKQIAVIFAIAAVGFFASKCGIINEQGNRTVSKVILYITLPAMIIASVADVPDAITAGDILLLIAISFLTYLILGIIAWLTPKMLRCAPEDRGVYTFVTMFGNVGFMGFPVLASIYGNEAVFLAAIFNLSMNILSFTLGVLMVAPKGTKLNYKEFFTPAVTASIIAPLLYLAPFTVPQTIYDGFSLLGSATVPLAMLMIGSTIARLPMKDVWNMPRIYITSLIKLLVCPTAVWLLLKPIVNDPLFFGIAVILSMMPSATNSTLLCIEYGGNELLASRAVCVSTIFSAVTIPTMIFLLL